MTVGPLPFLREIATVKQVQSSQLKRLLDVTVYGPWWFVQAFRPTVSLSERVVSGVGGIGALIYNGYNLATVEKIEPDEQAGFEGVRKSQGLRAFTTFFSAPFWISRAFRPNPTTIERIITVVLGSMVILTNGTNYVLNQQELREADIPRGLFELGFFSTVGRAFIPVD